MRKVMEGTGSYIQIAAVMEERWKVRSPDEKFVSVQIGCIGTVLALNAELKDRGYTMDERAIFDGIIAIVGETTE